MSSFKFLFFGWLFASQKTGFSGFRTHFVLPSFLRYASELATPAFTILATVKIKKLEIEPINIKEKAS